MSRKKRMRKMVSKQALLLQSAARLYTLGVDLEGARERLRQMAAEGISYQSTEMLLAYHNFVAFQEQWNALEREYCGLRENIYKGGIFGKKDS
ncbi:MAG: hypothetical protein AAGU02_00640 [Lawsonibacter sp.]